MGRAFEESRDAYQNGDGARAKQLSDEGRRHKAEMEALNRQACDWIYHGATNSHIHKRDSDSLVANNTDSDPNEIDLHGLYVKEAVERTEQAIQAAQRCGYPNVHLIVGDYSASNLLRISVYIFVGKGLHSQANVAKIKPAIEDLMVKLELPCICDQCADKH
jgi:DNA-nicking Smr family endonuclease